MLLINKNIVCIFLILSTFFACSKSENNTENASDKEIVAGVNAVIYSTYKDLNAQAIELEISVKALTQNSTDANLTDAKKKWKATRQAWEQAEAFLFGPVSTEEIDPNIDTWPIAKDKLTNEKLSEIEHQLNDTYFDNAGEDIRGFHVLELLLWGKDGNNKATDLSSVQKKYLALVAINIVKLCGVLAEEWKKYEDRFLNPKITNTDYQGYKDVYTAIVGGMAGICVELADGKMKEIFVNQSPELEESPFANNSIADFINNIKGVKNIYEGTYGSSQQKGIQNFVKKYNIALYQKIANQLNVAIQSLEKISDPFGTAIRTQGLQVQNAIDAIAALKRLLDEDLMSLVKIKSNN